MSGQAHGKAFENLLKEQLFIGAAEEVDEWTAKIDVAARFDYAGLNLGTSIKASKNGGVIGLADACRFWRAEEPFRLMVGCWTQATKNRKEFYEVHEFILGGELLKRLWGGVTLEQVQAFHERLGTFGKGSHQAARSWAKEEKLRLTLPDGGIVLNPKINSGTQRRLQCSLKLADLVTLAAEFPKSSVGAPAHKTYGKGSMVGGLKLPHSMPSPPRR